MFNQQNLKEKNAIESLLNLVTEESLREIDYDKAIKDLAIKIRQSSSSSLKLARKSIAIKLVQSNSSSPQKLNSNVNSSVQDSRCRTELRTMSLYKPIDKTQTPFIQQHKFLITSIKTNRLKRNTSDYKQVVIPSDQITKALQAFNFLDKTPFIPIKKPAQQPKYFLRYKKKTN